MAEPLSRMDFESLHGSTKHDPGKNVKDSINLPDAIDPSHAKSINVTISKQKLKTYYSDNPNMFLDFSDSNQHLKLSDITYLIRSSQNVLKKLDLSGCGLTKLPEGLGSCYQLEELNLSNNSLQLAAICFSLAWLVRLKVLDLSSCGLKEWPYSLHGCSNLQALNLSDNFIGHNDLLGKLNCGKMFSLSSKLTRVIFEDAVYTKKNRG
jgi:hypothetical protein